MANQPVRIDNILYPSQEWYDINIAKKTTKKLDTEARKVQIQAGIEEARIKVGEITAGVQSIMGEADMDTRLAPPIDTRAGDVVAAGNGVISGAQGQLDSYQELINQLAEQSKEAAKRASEAQKGILASMKKRQEIEPIDMEQLTIDTLAKFGLTPESVTKVKGLMGELTTFNTQMADLEAQKQAALLRNEERPGRGISLMTAEGARISKTYNLEISAKAAQAGVVSQQIQMERGLWTDARSTTSQIVNAATYDQQQKLADIQWGLDTYKDLYDMASDEEQRTWNRTYTVAKDELNRQQSDLTNKLDMMTTAAENGINLNWTMADLQNRTLEDLTEEYSQTVAVAKKTEEGTEDIMDFDVIRAHIREDIRSIKTDNPDISEDILYQIIVDGILTSSISNKNQAITIAQEMFGKVEQKTAVEPKEPEYKEPVFGKMFHYQPLPAPTGLVGEEASKSFWEKLWGK